MRDDCRAEVFRRDGSKCRGCGRHVFAPEDPRALYWWHIGHVHEEPPRSLGGDPTDPYDCVLLCPDCHLPNGVHADRPTCTWLTDRKAYGRARFTWRDGRTWESDPVAA